jgi:hypothetical protein
LLFLTEIGSGPGLATGDDHVLERRLEMRASLDARLDHHVDRAADDDEMLDVVAPDEQSTFAVSTTPSRFSRRRKPWPLRWPGKKVLKAHAVSAMRATTNRPAATARMRVSNVMAMVLAPEG